MLYFHMTILLFVLCEMKLIKVNYKNMEANRGIYLEHPSALS